MEHIDQVAQDTGDDRFDRRNLLKTAAGGLVAGGLLAATPMLHGEVAAAAIVPNNFRGLVHATNVESLTYAYAALQTISEHYKDAKGRLVLDGDAVKTLTTDDGLNNVKAAHDGGADIVAANDALEMNGIDKDSLPDYIDTDNPGIIAVIDGQVKGYHYYKV